MEVLVTYDVSTTDTDGERRLRRVARICEGFGQRVQNSVFECTLKEAQLEQLVHRLEKAIDADQDSLRIYRLRQPRAQFVQVIGKSLDFDVREPLII
jgi:CRISPR-associated protein Cas2